MLRARLFSRTHYFLAVGLTPEVVLRKTVYVELALWII